MKHLIKFFLFLIAILQYNSIFSQDVLVSKTPIPTNLKSIDTIALLPESFSVNRPKYKGQITYNLRLINPTTDTLKYVGYGFSYPWYRFQVMDSTGNYVEIDEGWFCGTGLCLCVIPPGKCSIIFMREYKWKCRVGVNYYINSNATKKTVWTRLIDVINFK